MTTRMAAAGRARSAGYGQDIKDIALLLIELPFLICGRLLMMAAGRGSSLRDRARRRHQQSKVVSIRSRRRGSGPTVVSRLFGA